LNTKLNWKEWGLFGLGSFIIILSFIWDYIRYINEISTEIPNNLSGKNKMFSEILDYVPVDFNWPLFLTGELILLSGIILFINRKRMTAISFRPNRPAAKPGWLPEPK